MRRARPYIPGAVFHLTARTQDKQHWFDEPLRDEILTIIADAQERTDAQLLAHVVMSNHLHLIVRQGAAPLAQFMQPICRRTALAVQRITGRRGHVFEGRYRDKVCVDEKHVRNAIVYTHLNPCKANLCEDPAHYRWSSHLAYCGQQWDSGPRIVPWTGLFTSAENDESHLPYEEYKRYLQSLASGDTAPTNHCPTSARVAGPHEVINEKPSLSSIRPDLRDLVLATLHEIDPMLELETLRLRRHGRAACTVRRVVIERAIRAGYRGVQIARFLHVSEATVSKVATSIFGRPIVRFGR